MAANPSKLEEIIGALNCVQDYDCEDMAIIDCGCFRGLYSPHRYDPCKEEQETVKDNRKWLAKKLKKVMKALLENLVWPKGKSFCLRRLRTCSGAKNKKRKMQFQYDPKSYALNFDDGIEKNGDDDCVYLDFSARYACPFGINKVYLGSGAQS